MMMDGARRFLEVEVVKPKRIGATLARFARYFKPYWIQLVIVVVL